MRPAPASPRSLRSVLRGGAGAGALLLAFAAGRLTAPAAAPLPAPAMARQRPPEPPRFEVTPPAPLPAAAPASPVAAAPAARAAPVKLTPELANRVTREAKAKVEALREKVVSRCAPPQGETASVVYNLAFDPQGRQIMRAIAEDRRAPAPEFVRCVRALDTTIRVSAPGTTVALSIPVSYP